MAEPASISSRCTFCPAGPVWWVTSCIPRIAFAAASAASTVFTTFTPPPLPRPPAWIWAFTTTARLPLLNSVFAAVSASSTVVAISPSGTGTPYLRRISFAWYSWIFMVVCLGPV